MRVWSVAAMMAMCFLLGVASAQSYTIRVTRNTNLRASYSLESAIVGSASAGTTLKVVGRHNRWLRVNRNGNDAWMADWVAYTRVEGSEPTPGEGAGDIDNCCFVDRQCNSDQDWTDGYWAFQNNQCQAPAPSQAVAPAQPASGVILRTASGIVIGNSSGHRILPSASLIDLGGTGATTSYINCCERTWQCDSEQDWAEGYHAFQSNLDCGLPGLISVVGEPGFVAYHEQRLEQLRNRLPQRYNYVLDGLNKIQQLSIPGVDSPAGVFFYPWEGPKSHGWDMRDSAVIVHEACHVHRWRAGHPPPLACGDLDGWIREEVACREMELQVLIELDAPAHVIEWARGMVADTAAGNNYPKTCLPE